MTMLRAASVQMQARRLSSTAEFYDRVDYFTGVAADYGADFVTFPEYFSMMLLSAEPQTLQMPAMIDRLTELQGEFIDRLGDMATRHKINIIGGSYAARVGDVTRNSTHVFLRDGRHAAQEKLHPTPDEAAVWGVRGGDQLEAIETDCGKIGVLICYDSEFPEAARHLTEQGARVIFVPYNTDALTGHLRVTYCCQARAVENQVYVVTSGMVGALENVFNLDLHHAQSGIFTPCDHPFARLGIAAQATENAEGLIFADLDMAKLDWAREKGAVRNWADRRPDLYQSWQTR